MNVFFFLMMKDKKKIDYSYSFLLQLNATKKIKQTA